MEIKEFNEEIYVEMLENGELYDYITNLQQENEGLKEQVKREVEVRDYEFSLKEDYKSRIEKAVEYLKYQLNNLTTSDIDIKAKMLCAMTIIQLEGRSDE